LLAHEFFGVERRTGSRELRLCVAGHGLQRARPLSPVARSKTALLMISPQIFCELGQDLIAAKGAAWLAFASAPPAIDWVRPWADTPFVKQSRVPSLDAAYEFSGEHSAGKDRHERKRCQDLASFVCCQ